MPDQRRNTREQAGGVVDGYQPALDGVRALAVAVVVLFHAGVSALPGGFLGVDAFFVLSGFLITSLLLGEVQRSGRVKLTAFWGRRARRLLPALLVMLVAVAVAGRYLLPPLDFRLLRGDEFAALGYVANWRMIYRGADYFAQTAAASPVQHTWSLGIEEQFYLLWPLILVAVLVLPTRLRRRPVSSPPAGSAPAGVSGMLVAVIAGAFASALAAGLLYRQDNPNRAYFGTDSRAQALLIGCALALLLVRFPRLLRDGTHRRLGIAALVSALLLAFLVTQAHGSSGWLYHGGLTLGALAVAIVLAHATISPASPTARLLSLAPLVWLGRISYGVYLWHWPLFQFLNAGHTGLSGGALLAARLCALLLVAIASYLLVEQPVRTGRWLRRGRALIPAGVGALAVAVTAALVLVTTTPPATPSVTAALASAPKAAPQPSTPGQSPVVPPMQRPGRLPGAQPRVDIFGDSVAWTIGTYLPAHPGLTVTTRAIEGCGLTLLPDIVQLGSPHQLYDYCPGWPGRYTAGVNADDPDVSVLLINRWELMDAKLDGAYQHVGEPAFDSYLLGQLDQAVRIIGSRGARVVLLSAAYTHRSERPDGGLYDEDQPSRVDALNLLLHREAAAHPAQVLVLDLNKLVCPNGRYTDSVGGLLVRSDGLHFTPAGVQQLIAPWLLPQVSSLASRGVP
jgi:peptidoglycan/LPS O-acetylase OafA/YrhL